MKKPFLLFVALLLLFSCSPEEKNEEITPNPQPPSGEQPVGTFNFTAETTMVLPYKILMLSSNNQDFRHETYDAKFGGRDVTLVKNPEGNLIFGIPEVESGEYSLILNIDGKEGKIDFEVNPSQISNANTVITAELEEPLKILKQDIDILISEGGLIKSTIEQLNSAKLMYSDFNEKFSTLSDDERMDIAQFYKANPIFSSRINNENRTAERAAANDFSCFINNADILAPSAGVLPDWEKVAILIEGTGAENIKGAGVGIYVGGYLAASTILASRERLITSCKRPVSSSLIDEAGNTANFELTNNTFTSFQLKTGVRALVASDINDPNETVSKTVESINQVAANWEKTKTSLNTVTSNTSGWFNSWLPGNSGYQPFSSLQNLPASPGNESLLEGNEDYINIMGLPSDVTAEVERNEAGKLNIKFNAPENTLPRNITGKIKYDDWIFSMTNDFAFTLSAAAYNYKLEIGYYNLDQTITTVKILSQGDAITLPNNMNRYIRITLDGEPVSAGPNNEGGWYNWTFGDSNQTPVDSEDIFIEDYEIQIPDYLHGGISAYFYIDLTLSNLAFRHLLEYEYRISHYYDGIIQGESLKIQHKAGGVMDIISLEDGSVRTQAYDFSLGVFSAEEQCLNYVFKTPVIGVIRIGGYGFHGGPGFMYILEDGNLRGNVMPYGCYDTDSGFLLEKI